jgi:hypothetical protein
MNKISNFIKNLMSKHKDAPLGRWRYEKCDKTMNYKIDLSNEDHCGPCGQYALYKIKSEKTGSEKICLEKTCLEKINLEKINLEKINLEKTTIIKPNSKLNPN